MDMVGFGKYHVFSPQETVLLFELHRNQAPGTDLKEGIWG